MEQLTRIYEALTAMRAPAVLDEHSLHTLAMQALKDADIPAEHEVSIAPRCRIDILAYNIGIEIKRGRPSKTSLLKQ